MAAKEANPNQLIAELANVMEKEGMVTPPRWSLFVKTGAHAERPPEDPNWWYTRAASVLRQVYMRGPIGVGKLRNWYGGRKKRGVKPEKHYPAGGKIIRVCLQQLEQVGLIQKEKVGRKITAKGQALIDKTAAVVNSRSKAAPSADAKHAPDTKNTLAKPKPKSKTKNTSTKSAKVSVKDKE